MMVYNELWRIADKYPGSFEFKQAVIFQAGRAIKESDVRIMYFPVTTFHPDYPEDGVTEYASGIVTKYVQETGMEAFVKEQIEKRNRK